MSYQNRERKADYNIRQGKGFQCPLCESFIPAGYDVCPRCGEQPGTDSHDNTMLYAFIKFISFIASPIFYAISTLGYAGEFLIILSSPLLFIVIILSFFGILKRIKILKELQKKISKYRTEIKAIRLEEKKAKKKISSYGGRTLLKLGRTERRETINSLLIQTWIFTFSLLSIYPLVLKIIL